MSKHLTLNDRVLIERYIIEGFSFSCVSQKLHRIFDSYSPFAVAFFFSKGAATPWGKDNIPVG